MSLDISASQFIDPQSFRYLIQEDRENNHPQDGDASYSSLLMVYSGSIDIGWHDLSDTITRRKHNIPLVDGQRRIVPYGSNDQIGPAIACVSLQGVAVENSVAAVDNATVEARSVWLNGLDQKDGLVIAPVLSVKLANRNSFIHRISYCCHVVYRYRRGTEEFPRPIGIEAGNWDGNYINLAGGSNQLVKKGDPSP